MRRIILFLVWQLALMSTVCCQELMGILTRVIDGDTYVVTTSKEKIKVRLYGIDCPESNQPFGREATEFVKQFLNSPVMLVDKGRDQHNRTLAELYIDGQRLSLLLVRHGLAHHFTKYSDDLTLAKAQVQAQNYRKGLWVQSSPIAPWEWRKGVRNEYESSPSQPGHFPLSTPDSKVFVCNSNGATKYHTQRKCGALTLCKSEIIMISTQEALSRGKNLCAKCGGKL